MAMPIAADVHPPVASSLPEAKPIALQDVISSGAALILLISRPHFGLFFLIRYLVVFTGFLLICYFDTKHQSFRTHGGGVYH